MLLLEGSDTQIRFRIQEIDEGLATDINLDDYEKILLEFLFADGRKKEVEANATELEQGNIVFDIFGEYTKKKAGVVKADIRGVKGPKKVRFNETTIKGKVLASVKIPDVM